MQPYGENITNNVLVIDTSTADKVWLS